MQGETLDKKFKNSFKVYLEPFIDPTLTPVPSMPHPYFTGGRNFFKKTERGSLMRKITYSNRGGGTKSSKQQH